MEYWIVEPSETRRAWQRRKLAQHGDRVRWTGDLASLTRSTSDAAGAPPAGRCRGVIFSNELLDAMPVHVIGWDAKARIWFEWGVACEAGRFVWTRMHAPAACVSERQSSAPSSVSQLQIPIQSELLEVLPDGFTTELSPTAERWWREAATALECGKLITVDYGLTAEELSLPQEKGRNRARYHRHRLVRDVLANPGQQDITAQVNFSAIRAVGESAGLKTEAFLTQSQFLTSIAARTWNDDASLGKWTSERTRQFQTLTHPEHLGTVLPSAGTRAFLTCSLQGVKAKETKPAARNSEPKGSRWPPFRRAV